MMLDTMDGFLHAVAIGPTTLKPRQWLPPIWGHISAFLMGPTRDFRGKLRLRLRNRPETVLVSDTFAEWLRER